ncbi:MAG: lysophospholipid acyltransferase family protein [Acidimicrobiia bacterium]
MTAPDWSASPRKRAEVAVIATLGYPILNALGSTWTWKVSGAEHVEAITARGLHPIHSFWHGRILPATHYFKRRGIVVITSENFDGEWIARIITKFGYGTARGSTSKGGPKALLQLVREVKSTGVAFTLDGPRGPAEGAQMGAVWLAKATGNPLMPFHAEAASHWTLKSWDRTQIPKPFTTVAMAIGEPLYVPRDAGEAALEEWRHRLQQSLAECAARSKDLLCR